MSDQRFIANSVAMASPSTGKTSALGGTLHTFKLIGDNTGNQYALMEAIVQPYVLVMPHVHTREDELTIVLEGEGGMRVGDQEFQVGPGSYIFIPRGTPHAVWNPTDLPGKAITLFSPAGLENYFEEMGRVYQMSSPPDVTKLAALGAKYGISPVMEWVPMLSAKYGVKLG